MRISDWSSDVCSSDLSASSCFRARASRATSPTRPASSASRCSISGREAARERRTNRTTTVPDRRKELGQWFHQPENISPESNVLVETSGPRSEEHTSELQSLMRISYAVFCLKKKKYHNTKTET